jgi:hypothetical protein
MLALLNCSLMSTPELQEMLIYVVRLTKLRDAQNALYVWSFTPNMSEPNPYLAAGLRAVIQRASRRNSPVMAQRAIGPICIFMQRRARSARPDLPPIGQSGCCLPAR